MSAVETSLPTDAPWYHLPAQWRAAPRWVRVRTVALPLVPPLLLVCEPFLGLLLASVVLLVGCLVAACRLLIQPLRIGEPTTFLAWRLPFALALAAAAVYVGVSSYDHAQGQARDIILALDESGYVGRNPAWVCGDEDECTVYLGFPLVRYPAWVSRTEVESYDRALTEFHIVMSLGPDDRLTFSARQAEGVQVVHRADLHERVLDPTTLEVVSATRS